MKRIYAIIGKAFLTGMLLFTACSGEDVLEPSGVNDNHFKVPNDAQDAESVLRREFYDNNGIYLFFNDTLRKEYVGKDAYGDDVWKVETIGLQYNLTSTSSQSLRYSFMTELADKQKAVALVEEKIMPHIGKAMRPYSILLTHDFQIYDYGWEDSPCFLNMRCLAIAVGEWVDMKDDEKEAYAIEVCKTLLQGKLEDLDIDDAFYDLSGSYYGEYISDYVDDWDRNMEDVYGLGFLSYTKDRYGDYDYDYLPYYRTDFDAYFNAVMDQTEEEFNEQYGAYPLVMQKYYILRNAILELGYIF